MSKPKALVNESDHSSMYLVKRLFEHIGFEVEMVFNNVDLSGLVKTHQPEFVTVDDIRWYEPDELINHVKTIRNDPKTAKTEMIFTTLTNERYEQVYKSRLQSEPPKQREHLLNTLKFLGVHFINKPIDIRAMRDLIQELQSQ